MNRHSALLGLEDPDCMEDVLVGTDVWIPTDSPTQCFQKATIEKVYKETLKADVRICTTSTASQQIKALADNSSTEMPELSYLVDGKVQSLLGSGTTKTVDLKDCMNVNEGTDGDLMRLQFTNDAAILDCLNHRYKGNLIYSYVKPMVIILNPYIDLKVTGRDMIRKYHPEEEDPQEPHVYSLCRAAWDHQLRYQENVAFIISGESGAGKTETTKHVMRYFSEINSPGILEDPDDNANHDASSVADLSNHDASIVDVSDVAVVNHDASIVDACDNEKNLNESALNESVLNGSGITDDASLLAYEKEDTVTDMIPQMSKSRSKSIMITKKSVFNKPSRLSHMEAQDVVHDEVFFEEKDLSPAAAVGEAFISEGIPFARNSKALILGRKSKASPLVSPVQEAIMQANPLLESFGNAKTERNNNSSRFGRFIELYIDQTETQTGIYGGVVSAYLLEKSRVVTCGENERCYHILYQIIKGLDPDEKAECKVLDNIWDYKMLHGTAGCYNITDKKKKPEKLGSGEAKNTTIHDITNEKIYLVPNVDDAADWRNEVRPAFNAIGFTEDMVKDLVKILSAILRCGNIYFCPGKAGKDGEEGTPECSNPADLTTICELLGIEESLAVQAVSLKMRKMPTGSITYTPRDVESSRDMILSVARGVYEQIFHQGIVKKLNEKIKLSPEELARPNVGVLDIFGFEYFQENSLEQFLINYANERLQQFFLQVVFRAEIELLESEGLDVSKLQFSDNTDVLKLIDSSITTVDNTVIPVDNTVIPMDKDNDTVVVDNPTIMREVDNPTIMREVDNKSLLSTKKMGKSNPGILQLLEEQCLLSKGTDDGFGSAVLKQFVDHPRLQKPRFTAGGVVAFTVIHGSAAVTYSSSGFRSKNLDKLDPSLVALLKKSTNPLVAEIFYEDSNSTSSSSSSTSSKKDAKMKGSLIGSQFSRNMEDLLDKLRNAKGHFMRCMKPNRIKKPGVYEPKMVLQQLKSLSVLEAIDMRKKGYAYRTSFKEFISEKEYFSLLLCSAQQPGISLKIIEYTEEQARNATIQIVEWLRGEARKEHWDKIKEKEKKGEIVPDEEKAAVEEIFGIASCFVGKSLVFFTRQAQRMLIAKKRKCLEQLRPAASLIQASIRGKPLIMKFNQDMQKVISIQALMRRFQVQQRVKKVKKLKSVFIFAACLGRSQERFRKLRRAAIKIQKNVRIWLERVRKAKLVFCQAIKMRRAKLELKRLRAEALRKQRVKAVYTIHSMCQVQLSRKRIAHLKLTRAATDIGRVWRGCMARKLAAVLRKERIARSIAHIQGHFKTLYCRTLLMQFQATKAFHKAGKCVLATRTMNRLMDYTGRHHLQYLTPKQLRTHNYQMPALTPQGKPNPLLKAVKDTKKYVCVSTTNIPYYRYPEENGDGEYLVCPDDPEGTGLRRGQWISAAQHTEKWIMSDCGLWIPMYVNGVRVLEPLKGTKNQIIVPPPRSAKAKQQKKAQEKKDDKAIIDAKDPTDDRSNEVIKTGLFRSGSDSNLRFMAGVNKRAFRVTKTLPDSCSLSPHRTPMNSGMVGRLSAGGRIIIEGMEDITKTGRISAGRLMSRNGSSPKPFKHNYLRGPLTPGEKNTNPENGELGGSRIGYSTEHGWHGKNTPLKEKTPEGIVKMKKLYTNSTLYPDHPCDVNNPNSNIISHVHEERHKLDIWKNQSRAMIESLANQGSLCYHQIQNMKKTKQQSRPIIRMKELLGPLTRMQDMPTARFHHENRGIINGITMKTVGSSMKMKRSQTVDVLMSSDQRREIRENNDGLKDLPVRDQVSKKLSFGSELLDGSLSQKLSAGPSSGVSAGMSGISFGMSEVLKGIDIKTPSTVAPSPSPLDQYYPLGSPTITSMLSPTPSIHTSNSPPKLSTSSTTGGLARGGLSAGATGGRVSTTSAKLRSPLLSGTMSTTTNSTKLRNVSGVTTSSTMSSSTTLGKNTGSLPTLLYTKVDVSDTPILTDTLSPLNECIQSARFLLDRSPSAAKKLALDTGVTPTKEKPGQDPYRSNRALMEITKPGLPSAIQAAKGKGKKAGAASGSAPSVKGSLTNARLTTPRSTGNQLTSRNVSGNVSGVGNTLTPTKKGINNTLTPRAERNLTPRCAGKDAHMQLTPRAFTPAGAKALEKPMESTPRSNKAGKKSPNKAGKFPNGLPGKSPTVQEKHRIRMQGGVKPCETRQVAQLPLRSESNLKKNAQQAKMLEKGTAGVTGRIGAVDWERVHTKCNAKPRVSKLMENNNLRTSKLQTNPHGRSTKTVQPGRTSKGGYLDGKTSKNYRNSKSSDPSPRDTIQLGRETVVTGVDGFGNRRGSLVIGRDTMQGGDGARMRNTRRRDIGSKVVPGGKPLVAKQVRKFESGNFDSIESGESRDRVSFSNSSLERERKRDESRDDFSSLEREWNRNVEVDESGIPLILDEDIDLDDSLLLREVSSRDNSKDILRDNMSKDDMSSSRRHSRLDTGLSNTSSLTANTASRKSRTPHKFTSTSKSDSRNKKVSPKTKSSSTASRKADKTPREDVMVPNTVTKSKVGFVSVVAGTKVANATSNENHTPTSSRGKGKGKKTFKGAAAGGVVGKVAGGVVRKDTGVASGLATKEQGSQQGSPEFDGRTNPVGRTTETLIESIQELVDEKSESDKPPTESEQSKGKGGTQAQGKPAGKKGSKRVLSARGENGGKRSNPPSLAPPTKKNDGSKSARTLEVRGAVEKKPRLSKESVVSNNIVQHSNGPSLEGSTKDALQISLQGSSGKDVSQQQTQFRDVGSVEQMSEVKRSLKENAKTSTLRDKIKTSVLGSKDKRRWSMDGQLRYSEVPEVKTSVHPDRQGYYYGSGNDSRVNDSTVVPEVLLQSEIARRQSTKFDKSSEMIRQSTMPVLETEHQNSTSDRNRKLRTNHEGGRVSVNIIKNSATGIVPRISRPELRSSLSMDLSLMSHLNRSDLSKPDVILENLEDFEPVSPPAAAAILNFSPQKRIIIPKSTVLTTKAEEKVIGGVITPSKVDKKLTTGKVDIMGVTGDDGKKPTNSATDTKKSGIKKSCGDRCQNASKNVSKVGLSRAIDNSVECTLGSGRDCIVPKSNPIAPEPSPSAKTKASSAAAKRKGKSVSKEPPLREDQKRTQQKAKAQLSTPTGVTVGQTIKESFAESKKSVPKPKPKSRTVVRLSPTAAGVPKKAAKTFSRRASSNLKKADDIVLDVVFDSQGDSKEEKSPASVIPTKSTPRPKLSSVVAKSSVVGATIGATSVSKPKSSVVAKSSISGNTGSSTGHPPKMRQKNAAANGISNAGGKGDGSVEAAFEASASKVIRRRHNPKTLESDATDAMLFVEKELSQVEKDLHDRMISTSMGGFNNVSQSDINLCIPSNMNAIDETLQDAPAPITPVEMEPPSENEGVLETDHTDGEHGIIENGILLGNDINADHIVNTSNGSDGNSLEPFLPIGTDQFPPVDLRNSRRSLQGSRWKETSSSRDNVAIANTSTSSDMEKERLERVVSNGRLPVNSRYNSRSRSINNSQECEMPREREPREVELLQENMLLQEKESRHSNVSSKISTIRSCASEKAFSRGSELLPRELLPSPRDQLIAQEKIALEHQLRKSQDQALRHSRDNQLLHSGVSAACLPSSPKRSIMSNLMNNSLMKSGNSEMQVIPGVVVLNKNENVSGDTIMKKSSSMTSLKLESPMNEPLTIESQTKKTVDPELEVSDPVEPVKESAQKASLNEAESTSIIESIKESMKECINAEVKAQKAEVAAAIVMTTTAVETAAKSSVVEQSAAVDESQSGVKSQRESAVKSERESAIKSRRQSKTETVGRESIKEAMSGLLSQPTIVTEAVTAMVVEVGTTEFLQQKKSMH